MTFFSHFPLERTTSRIPDRQANKSRASRAQILVNPASRKAVKSRFPSRCFASSRIRHHILVKSWIPKIPSQTLANLQHSPALTRPLIPPTTQATSGSRISIRVPLARPFLPGGILGISSDGDDLRIFLGLKFSIPGFVWV